MEAHVFAVIDTNVFVSAMLSHNADAATVRVVDSIRNGRITPVYNEEILAEYSEVLRRRKFNFSPDVVNRLLRSLKQFGVATNRTPYGSTLPDPKDRVFYEVSLTGGSYLVTGNQKHFPHTPKVVTPAEMMQILERESLL